MSWPETSLKPNILLSPLDWGLGHATRCIPVIRELLRKNCSVILAADGTTGQLLQSEFPGLKLLPLKGYNIRYSSSRWTLPFRITGQIPKILSTIQHETEWLEETVEKENIHGIISDNRYGLYYDRIPSVFITHQLLIKTPLGRKADQYLQKLNYEYISNFTECWVPDNLESISLAGELSHPKIPPPVPVRYVGPLSRFEKTNDETKHLLIVLSGPEPQRTLLENLLLEQLADHKDPVVLVRGLPGSAGRLQVPHHVTVFNHLTSAELNREMNRASMVVSRCGYSTVMDLAHLQKRGVLIPTPGQTEQEYLANHLMQTNFALCIEQGKFRLQQALFLAAHFEYRLPPLSVNHSLSEAVDGLISRVR